MGMSVQRHASASLYPPGKGLPVPIVQEAGWAPEPAWTQEAMQDYPLASARDRTSISVSSSP
jgi:hypothetical protein